MPDEVKDMMMAAGEEEIIDEDIYDVPPDPGVCVCVCVCVRACVWYCMPVWCVCVLGKGVAFYTRCVTELLSSVITSLIFVIASSTKCCLIVLFTDFVLYFPRGPPSIQSTSHEAGHCQFFPHRPASST